MALYGALETTDTVGRLPLAGVTAYSCGSKHKEWFQIHRTIVPSVFRCVASRNKRTQSVFYRPCLPQITGSLYPTRRGLTQPIALRGHAGPARPEGSSIRGKARLSPARLREHILPIGGKPIRQDKNCRGRLKLGVDPSSFQVPSGTASRLKREIVQSDLRFGQDFPKARGKSPFTRLTSDGGRCRENNKGSAP